jgi:hypothetical protein
VRVTYIVVRISNIPSMSLKLFEAKVSGFSNVDWSKCHRTSFEYSVAVFCLGWYKRDVRSLFLAFGLLVSACEIRGEVGPGKACDDGHRCKLGRRCVAGFCTDVADASVEALGDAGDAPNDGGTAVEDAGRPDVGVDAGVLFGLGVACSVNTLCASGFCSQGVCCNASCDGACQSCSGGACRLKPAGVPGTPTCGPYLSCTGTSAICPANCDAGSCSVGRCDLGKCVQKLVTLSTDFSNGWKPLFLDYAAGGQVSLVNGAVQIENQKELASDTGLRSSELFDLEGSQLSVDLVSAGAPSLVRQVGVRIGQGDTYVYLIENEGKLIAMSHVAGGDYPEIGKIDSGDGGSKKIRIREADGTIYFEASFATGQWVPVASRLNPLPIALRNLEVILQAYCFQNDTCGGGTAIFDNVNSP